MLVPVRAVDRVQPSWHICVRTGKAAIDKPAVARFRTLVLQRRSSGACNECCANQQLQVPRFAPVETSTYSAMQPAFATAEAPLTKLV